MADRVHPRAESPPESTVDLEIAHHHQHNDVLESPRHPNPPMHEKPVPPPQAPVQPPPGTYVIQVPKDQVYRVPPPENAKRLERLSRRKPSRGLCCCCFCWSLGILAVLILLLGIAAGVLYLVFRPEAPDYTVENLSIKGFNLTPSSPISPEFDVTVRADNKNDKIGIYYRGGSDASVFYNDVRLCNGALPVFYQGANNVTTFVTALKGSGIELNSAARGALSDEQTQGAVPFKVKLRAPVKLKVGAVKTWEFTVKVDCDITVDKLTENAKVVNRDCDYGVDIW